MDYVEINGRKVLFTSEFVRHIGVSKERFKSLSARGVIPPADGKHYPPYGKPGRRGKYWYVETVLLWEAKSEYDFTRPVYVHIGEIDGAGRLEPNAPTDTEVSGLAERLAGIMSFDSQDDAD